MNNDNQQSPEPYQQPIASSQSPQQEQAQPYQQVQSQDQQPYVQPQPVASVPPPQPPDANYTPPQVANQPAQPATTASASDYKKVRVIGTTMMVLSGLQLLPFAFDLDGGSASNTVGAFIGAVGLLIGYGLIRHGKVAYYAFNVLAILSIIAVLFTVAPLLYILAISGGMSGMNVNPALLAFFVITGALVLVVPVFYIVGGIILHKKSIRQIFLD